MKKITLLLLIASPLLAHRGRTQENGHHNVYSNGIKIGEHYHKGNDRSIEYPNQEFTNSTYDRKKFGYTYKSRQAYLSNQRKTINTNGVIISNTWQDSYTGDIYTDTSKIQIDHKLSLKEAFNRGASNWSPQKMKAFGNDTNNFAITSSSLNQSKSSKPFITWLLEQPFVHKVRCFFIENFVNFLISWGFVIEESEYSAKQQCIIQ